MPTPTRVPEVGPSEVRLVIRLTPLEWRLLARKAGVALTRDGRVKNPPNSSDPTMAGFVREQLSLLPRKRARS